MYKKIILVLSALIILSLPYQQQYVEGAILSKVASKGAQKVVKEVIKESAFDMAVDLFVNAAWDMAEADAAKYKAQSDYELFCGKKMPDLITCEKPMQVKKVLTTADKTNIGNQAEIELDKLITGGKGFTRWQKFMDWFLPIWVSSLALTAITYAIDPEVRSLFNEAGYNALVALGLIKPIIDTNEQEPATSDPKPAFETKPTDGIVENPEYKQITVTDTTSPTDINIDGLSIETENVVMEVFTHSAQTRTNSSFFYRDATNVAREMWSFKPSTNTVAFIASATGTTSVQKKIAVTKNGTLVYEGETTTSTFTGIPSEHLSGLATKTQSIRTRLPYKIGDFYYTDVLAFTTDGDTYHYQIRLGSHTIPSNITRVYYQGSRSAPSTVTETMTVYKNKSPYKKIIIPTYEEVEQSLTVPKSKYEDENGQVALIPPMAIPHTQTSTGVALEPSINEETGDREYKTPTGEIVPEDDITVGEPNVQDNPSPSPNTVTPPATQTNPNPEPIPLTPTTPEPTVPPPNTPTPIETLPPVIPEGESCDVGLKLPKFNPLMHTISDAFPFSIPFDLKDGFDALFAEMGNEKPEFDYKFKFMGDEQSWKITIPDYFDSWKAFTDSFLIFIFDIGIIYAIYRFMGGGS